MPNQCIYKRGSVTESHKKRTSCFLLGLYKQKNHIQHPRISDFCDRLIYLFDLSHVCPHGITLSINGDLILSSETSHVLRETDIVRVGMKNEHGHQQIKKVKEESYEGQEEV